MLALKKRVPGLAKLSSSTASSSASQKSLIFLFVCCELFGKTTAHLAYHMDTIPDGQAVSADPIDSILWIHILMQILTFGVIFPTGMVLGVVKNRWHVPVQVLGTVLAIIGYFLGHLHKGRAFAPTAHRHFSNILMLMLAGQVVLGIYLRLHLTKGINGKVRGIVVKGHSILGKIMPVASWLQMLFGGIAALGYCRGDHLGQCLAHFIMGSGFISYGVLLTILLLVGQGWLRRTGRSQEFFDSTIIAAWGCVNTFTEHRWGGAWVENDVQHTTMGVIWWCAGLAGIWLSKTRDGAPKRNFIPGFVLLLTGWGMSGHPQHLPLSTMVHRMFGYTLMAAGVTRIIEIAFILKDAAKMPEEPNSFQYVPVFLLYASGFLFMAATEEQMEVASNAGIDHVSYVLAIYSFAFLLFLLVNMLLHLYVINSSPDVPPKDNVPLSERPQRIHINGHVRGSDSRQIRDAEEFELEGLMSEDEDQLSSPSTVGKNNQVRAD